MSFAEARILEWRQQPVIEKFTSTVWNEGEEIVKRQRDIIATTTDRSRELQWIDAHRNEYLGEWVVVEGGHLIAHGHDARKVYDAARVAGIEVPFLIHVQPLDKLPFGGW